MTPHEPSDQYSTLSLREGIAYQVRAFREARDWSQDDLAERLRGQGFWGWTRSVVAALENNGRRVEIEDAIALAIVFNVRLSDFIAPEHEEGEMVRLVNAMCVPTEAVRRVLDGGLANADGSEGLFYALEVGPNEDWDEVTRRYLKRSELGDLEQRIAARLNRSATDVALAARSLWGHSATDERERRAADRPGARQHISRQILKEIQQYMTPEDDLGSEGGQNAGKDDL